MDRLGTIASGLLLLALESPCAGATLTVDLKGGGDITTIQAAVDAANDGDTVLVKPGEYVITEPIDFNRDRSLLGRGARNPDDPSSPPVKEIVLRSESGPAVTTIRMSETPVDPARASVVTFVNGEGRTSVLEGFTP